jgi:hypothetical protein
MNIGPSLPQRVWLTAATLGALFTIKFGILMNGSVIFGRLAVPPLYDDVYYFVDALDRVRLFDDSGLWAVISNAIAAPPHAPYSTIAAGLAFLVIGPYPAAAYFMNVVSLFLITMFWTRLFRVPFPISVLFGAAIICTGWFDAAVTIFHPDLIMGYGAAIIAAALVFQDEVLSSTRRVVSVGVAAGLVLLTKPSAFVAPLALLFVAFASGAVASVTAGDTFRSLGRRAAIGLGAMVLVAGSYYAVSLMDVLNYMYTVLVLDREIWDAHLSGIDDLLFYFYQLQELFGIWGYFAFILLFINVTLSILRGNKPAAIRLAGLLLCTLAGYTIQTLTSVKAMRFGMLVYGMIAATLGINLLYLLRYQLEVTRWRSLAGASAAIVFLMMVMTFADKQVRFPPGMLIDVPREFRVVYGIIQQQRELRQRELLSLGRPLRVLQPLLIGVPVEAYKFRALKEGFTLDFNHFETEGDLQVILAATRDADMVVVPDAALNATIFHYRINSVVDAFRSELPARGFVQVASVPMTAGNALVFARSENSDSTQPANPGTSITTPAAAR